MRIRKWLGALVMLATPAQRQHEPLKKYCSCGVLVWDVQHRGQLPRYEGCVICLGCGQDHSRVPTLLWLVRFYWKSLMKD